jgi:hypothetical protein
MTVLIATSGPFASTIEAFDASGASLGTLEVAVDGTLDYSAVAEGAVKLVITGPGGQVSEYELP